MCCSARSMSVPRRTCSRKSRTSRWLRSSSESPSSRSRTETQASRRSWPGSNKSSEQPSWHRRSIQNLCRRRWSRTTTTSCHHSFCPRPDSPTCPRIVGPHCELGSCSCTRGYGSRSASPDKRPRPRWNPRTAVQSPCAGPSGTWTRRRRTFPRCRTDRQRACTCDPPRASSTCSDRSILDPRGPPSTSLPPPACTSSRRSRGRDAFPRCNPSRRSRTPRRPPPPCYRTPRGLPWPGRNTRHPRAPRRTCPRCTATNCRIHRQSSTRLP
mmetsp:Transcript_1348/g.5490  ORF Transcript_1348/g.5490 Transcript_1348/m.5490 type:complete len:269 (+) Transcript_1348:294-1100(+)